MESKRSGFGFLCRESMMPQLKLARAIQCKTSSLSGAFELDHVGDLCKGRLEHHFGCLQHPAALSFHGLRVRL